MNKMAEFLTRLPIWESIRLLGLLSYFLLFASISIGILYSMPFWKGRSKATLYKVHSTLTISSTFCGLLHASLLIVDTYMPFDWGEVLIPFASQHEPFFNGLGTIALYGTLLIIFTTDIRNKLNKTLWRLIHICSYPTFLAALAHGLGVGTDTKNLLVYLMYIITFGIIMLLLIIRIFIGRKRDVAYLANRG